MRPRSTTVEKLLSDAVFRNLMETRILEAGLFQSLPQLIIQVSNNQEWGFYNYLSFASSLIMSLNLVANLVRLNFLHKIVPSMTLLQHLKTKEVDGEMKWILGEYDVSEERDFDEADLEALELADYQIYKNLNLNIKYEHLANCRFKFVLKKLNYKTESLDLDLSAKTHLTQVSQSLLIFKRLQYLSLKLT